MAGGNRHYSCCSVSSQNCYLWFLQVVSLHILVSTKLNPLVQFSSLCYFALWIFSCLVLCGPSVLPPQLREFAVFHLGFLLAPCPGNCLNAVSWRNCRTFVSFLSCMTILYCLASSVLQTVSFKLLFFVLLLFLFQAKGKAGLYYSILTISTTVVSLHSCLCINHVIIKVNGDREIREMMWHPEKKSGFKKITNKKTSASACFFVFCF